MKKGKLITLISVFILCLSLLSTLILETGIANRIAEVVTLITAVIGAMALYLQFKRDKEVNECSFILEFWNNFSENQELTRIMLNCDKDIKTKETCFKEDDYTSIVLYAQWLEALSAIIMRDVLDFDFIDNMYNYMFFVFVNNKYIQENELLPNMQYYQGIFTTYGLWVKYLKTHNKPVLLEENALDIASMKYDK